MANVVKVATFSFDIPIGAYWFSLEVLEHQNCRYMIQVDGMPFAPTTKEFPVMVPLTIVNPCRENNFEPLSTIGTAEVRIEKNLDGEVLPSVFLDGKSLRDRVTSHKQYFDTWEVAYLGAKKKLVFDVASKRITSSGITINTDVEKEGENFFFQFEKFNRKFRLQAVPKDNGQRIEATLHMDEQQLNFFRPEIGTKVSHPVPFVPTSVIQSSGLVFSSLG